MSGLSRRAFLIRGSMGTAVAGTVAAFPGLAGLMTTAEQDAPEADDASTAAVTSTAEQTSVGQLTDPLIAHVKDLQTGEMSLYMGNQEFTMRDPGLASRLLGGTK